MMSPTEHKTEAERLLSVAKRPGRILGEAEYTLIAAHAQLSRAAGTGEHYALASAALDTAAAASNTLHGGYTEATQAHVGLAHAQLAEQ